MPFLALVPVAVWVSLAITVAMTALQYALTATQKKPKPSVFMFDDDTQSVYDPLAPWKILNGEGRAGGAIIYKRTNTARTNLWMVVALGPGPIKSFGDLWLGDEPVFTTGAMDGEVQGKYATKLFCWTHLGTEDQTVDTNLQAAFPDDWTDKHRLRGIAYFVLKFVNDATLFGRGIPNPSISYRGLSHIDPRTGDTTYTDNPIICIRSWLMNSVWGRRQPASRFDTASIIEEANYCDEYIIVQDKFDLASVWQAQTFTAVAATDILTYGDGWSGADREHGLRYNDRVQVSSTTTLPAPLVAGTTYYARPETRLTLKLAASPTDTTPIDITTAGTGTHTMRLMGYRLTLGGNFASDTVVDTGADTLTMRENASNVYPRRHRVATRVQLTGTTAPAGTSFGTDYYITDGSTSNVIQISSTVSDAEAGTPINFTSVGSQVKVVFKSHGGLATMTTGSSLVTLTQDKSFYTGDVVVVSSSLGPSDIPEGTGYFWRRFPGGLTGTLHRSRQDAIRNLNAIVITDPVFQPFALYSDHFEPDDISSMPTGTIIELDNTPLGTIGGGIALNTEYYVINRGRGFADGHASSVIDLAASLSDALNDVPITVTSGITTQTTHTVRRFKERRYTLNGSFDTDTSYGEVLQAMLSSIGGYADPSGGKWRILPARYRMPDVTLGVDDVHGGSVELTTLLPANRAANTITGTFTTPVNLDIPANFPTVSDTDALALDGVTIQDDITLPFTNSKDMAVRLSDIELNRRQRQKTITFPTDLAGGWPVAVGESFIVDLPGIGQNGQPQVYECTRWALSTAGEGGSAPVPLISITGRENDPFIYRTGEL